jgi:hypothetical protein
LEPVGAAFKDEAVSAAAVNYGRKLLKVKAGLRTTPAPRTGLTATEAEKIRKLLGIAET